MTGEGTKPPRVNSECNRGKGGIARNNMKTMTMMKVVPIEDGLSKVVGITGGKTTTLGVSSQRFPSSRAVLGVGKEDREHL